MVTNSILDKVNQILEIAKKGTCSPKELKDLLHFSEEDSDNLILGRVFGYSVADYAIACLSWLKDEQANRLANMKLKMMSENRKDMIDELIASQLYTEV